MLPFLYGLRSISPAALAALPQRRAAVFDMNGRHRWAQAHVPGALALAPDFVRADLPADKATPLVFYCSNPLCRKAPSAATLATGLPARHDALTGRQTPDLNRYAPLRL